MNDTNTPKLLIAVAIAAVCCLLAACSSNEQSWERIAAEGRLKFGLDPSFPPFEATDGTTLYGIDVDLAAAISEDLGLEATFTHFGYDGLYDALISRQVDVLISALVIFPERTKDFKYSDSYFDSGQVVAAPNSFHFESYEDLVDQRVAVELGAEGHTLALEWQRDKPSLNILTYNSANEALSALSDGVADLAIVDSISGHLFFGGDHSQLNLTQVTNDPFAMVVRSEDTILLDKINESLSRLRDSGELEQILSTWLDQ